VIDPEHLAARLNPERPPVLPGPGGHRPAAVLVPLVLENGAWHGLFTERPHDLPIHPGQVSFPGGRAEPGDPDLAATALREAEEEIGLAASRVTLLGALPPRLTITDYWLTPIVGIVAPGTPLVPSPREVAEIFTVPWDWLADPANVTTEYRDHPRLGPATPVLFYRWPGHTIWGLTARIVSELAALARER
jgi:8-oxo-dGTP pyrophosphatase MutT (NUDIX family)